jgi:AraC-like DNA-binding protein
MSESLPLSLVDAALRGVVVALLVLLAGVLRRDRPRLPAARIGVVFTLALCVQVIASTPLLETQLPRLWQAPLVAVSVANAALFWIFVQALLDDDFTLRPRHIAAWLAAAALGGLNCAILGNSGSAIAPLMLGLQRALPLLFALLAAIAAASHWRADLVEGRRRLRGFIVGAGIAYTLALLVARAGSPQGRLSATAALLDMGLLFGIVAVVAGRLLRLGGSELFPLDAGAAAAAPEPSQPVPRATPPSSPDPSDPAEERLARVLQHAMADERVYRTEDLTVAALAARLGVPEYRLRRHINQRLGHRNFNAYINAFRLADARTALADASKRELPILTIALDAGFQSIGPFNRAFKATTGLTPGDFRREKLADS